MKNKFYVIGIDGGGTKTEAALADLRGKIFKITRSGPASPRNIGVKKTAQNVAEAISKLLEGTKNKKILSTYIGLPTVEKEEYKRKKDEIKKEILNNKKITLIKKGKIIIESDQKVAFRSGTAKRDGIVLISGTGCVCRGWRGGKDVKSSGWGWLADEGSGFWVGQKGFQAFYKELDGRGKKTLITKLIFRKWNLKSKEDLLKKVYLKDSIRQTSLISKIVDEAANREDKIARNIMEEVGKELALSAITVIKKLKFQKTRFPLILIGGMFNSKIVLNQFQKEVKKTAPKVEFVLPRVDPVIGAVKLAIEQLTINKEQLTVSDEDFES